MVRRILTMGLLVTGVVAAIATTRGQVYAAASEIVLYASEASVTRGHWAGTSSSGAADGRSMKSTDQGFSSTSAPQASPAHYFEMPFTADAATTYRVWLRLRAEGNSKWNDAVWVQFNDSTTTSGAAAYRIGTTSGLMVNLERCSGCGTSNWGWQNTAYWLSQDTTIRFAATGTHTIRVQTREDGVEIDQIVLSPVTYVSGAPGPLVNDSTILPKVTGSTSAPSAGLTPYKGSPFTLPGTVPASDFDNGGQDVAYSDGTSGNSGSAYRQTDVDLQGASIGGYNVGWTAAGEWLKYSVNVTSAATYDVTVRVASTSANTMQVTVGGVSGTFSVPNTGGWQNWTTVTVPMALAAGQQTMTVKFNTGGLNLHSVSVAAPSSPAPPPPPPSGSGTGGTFRMMTWNVHHGKNKSNVLSVPAQAQFIASYNPQVVALQEVQTWDQNQPALFESELERLTGVNWTRVWAPVTSSAGTEGNVVLTRLPVSSTSTFQMHANGDWSSIGPNRSVAQATVTVGGVAVHVFSTHLDYANTSYRTAQLLDMMNWTQNFGAKRIVGGDFNSWWGEYWITTMMGDYYDTWQDVTGSNQNGYTVNNAVRFDYLFRSKSGSDKVTPTSVSVPGTALSDHNPVIADYRVVP